ncbi:MAG: ComF family protein [Alphaproteobacteria bacterium]|nr:ComF family protein [Alphaproteobacteria bacterium]
MVTPKVWASLNFISSPYCECCGRPFEFQMEAGMRCGECLSRTPPFARARAALAYDDASRELVLRFKHGDQTHAVLAFLPWIKRAGAELLAEADILIPVPLHRWRLLRRRYNQAAVIARALSRETGIAASLDALVRSRHTPPQGHLRAKERAKNVRHAFEVGPSGRASVEGRNVILIDDVYTTGATVAECASALLKAGCRQVDVLTLARVVRPGGGA